MTPLNRRLAGLRRRLRLVVVSRGTALALSALLGILIVGGLIDYQLQLPSLLRAFILVGALATAGYLAVRFLFMPLMVRTDNLSLALRVEECYPELNDALASTVQFLQQTAETRAATGSPTLRREAAKQAMRLAERCDFRKAVSARGVGWTLLGCLALAAAGGWLAYRTPALAGTALMRLLDPYGGHTWTLLEVRDCPTRVAVGQPYIVRGLLGGIVPASARLELASVTESERVVPVKADKEQTRGSIDVPLDMTQHKGNFRFRVRAGDAVFPAHGGWHEVAVVPPPEWVSLDGLPSPQIELNYPAYTDLSSPNRLTPGTRRIEAVEGTIVRLAAATDRPIERAWIEHRPENPLLRLATFLAPLGGGGSLQIASAWNAGQSVWGQFPAVLSQGGKELHITFQPRVSGTYIVVLQDAEQLINTYESDLRVQVDPIPIVQLEQPASSQDVLPNASIALRIRVHDEEFAVRSAFVEYRRRGADGKWLDAAPRKLPLYDHRLLNMPAPLGLGLALPVHLRLQRVDLETAWSLAGIAKEGETLVFSACADDFNNVVSNPPGRSGEVELSIVSPKQLAAIHDDRMEEIQQELLRLQRLQDEALKAVKNVKQDLGKDDRKNHDQLAEAGQQQKQVRERVGSTDEEGVRAAIKRLQQSMRDNELPPSNVGDRLKKLAAELERITEEDLKQIEPNLEEARKEIDSGKSEDKSAPLSKAEELQADAKKSLDELVKFLDPWASLHVVKGQARELLKEQRELKTDTEKLQEDPATANDAARTADAQKSLAERAEGLVQKMNEAAASRAEKGEEHTAKLLKEAAKIASQTPQKMRDAKNALDRQNTFEAVDKQKESIKQLEDAIAALEERRDDEVARLMKKHTEAKKKLDELIDRLEKKRKSADTKDDRAELEQLEKDVNEAARELAGMHADKAAKALDRAAENLKRALRQLEEKKDPEEAQQEAMKELENAAKKLAESEEQLAREQLARIADQIKTLKERQDAASAESKRLHEQSVEKLRRWTTPLLSSLRDLRGTQSELSEEAEKLRAKLEGAKVFEHILKQAGRVMGEAAEEILERKENGALRTLQMEPEEVADENARQERTLALQEQASNRLQRLLDALKDAPPQLAKKDEKTPEGKQPDPGDMNDKGGVKPGESIPDIAQLQALRDEQRDLNDRTRLLAERQQTALIARGGILAGAARALPPMDEAHTDQLRGLQEEQSELHRLFGEIAAAQQ